MPAPTVILQQPGDVTSERDDFRSPVLAVATGLALQGLVDDK